jgi:hypothetical protein
MPYSRIIFHTQILPHPLAILPSLPIQIDHNFPQPPSSSHPLRPITNQNHLAPLILDIRKHGHGEGVGIELVEGFDLGLVVGPGVGGAGENEVAVGVVEEGRGVDL